MADAIRRGVPQLFAAALAAAIAVQLAPGSAPAALASALRGRYPARCDATTGLAIASNLPRCRIHVLAQKPGNGAFERLRVTNTSPTRYVLSFRVAAHERLRPEVLLGVWRRGRRVSGRMRPLRFWMRLRRVFVLEPGRRLRVGVELQFPPAAGNRYQHKRAVVDFVWHATELP